MKITIEVNSEAETTVICLALLKNITHRYALSIFLEEEAVHRPKLHRDRCVNRKYNEEAIATLKRIEDKVRRQWNSHKQDGDKSK